jgi:hypothetical protein
MNNTCIACGYDAKVTMVLRKYSDYKVLPEIEPKSFCLHCMHDISKAYSNLRDNDFAGISLGSEQ